MKKIISIFLCGILAISCSENSLENLSNEESSATTSSSNIKVCNNMLIFSSQESMYNYINGKTEPIIKINFFSQKDMFNEIVEEEWKWFQANQNSLDQEQHSQLYYQRLKEGVIKEVRYSDSTESYAPNLSMPFYNKIINKEGFFAIGDTIFQITSNSVKKWIHGDVNNYSFLKHQTKTDESKGIYITDYSQQNEETSDIQTRAIFPVPNILTISTGIRCNFPENARTTVFVNDKIKINNINSYDRTLFFQISHQVLSGSVLRFVSKAYNFITSFQFVDKNAPTVLLDLLVLNQDYTGSCDYFYVWAPYMILPGQDVINYTDTYYYLYSFDFFVKDRRNSGGQGDAFDYINRYYFMGKRENYTSGTMLFDYADGNAHDYHWVTEMPQ